MYIVLCLVRVFPSISKKQKEILTIIIESLSVKSLNNHLFDNSQTILTQIASLKELQELQ